MVKTELAISSILFLKEDGLMDQIKIGKFIASLRKEKVLTQQVLGEKLGVTNKTISRWENGAYMPDIEMLKLLSDIFQVSINELLCGDRLSDTDFRKEADENVIAISRATIFSIKDKKYFWKHKWLKEHVSLIFFCILINLGLLGFAWIQKNVCLIGLSPILMLVAYAVLNNKMMIYIENQIYGQIDKK